jgi:hypothetical protein
MLLSTLPSNNSADVPLISNLTLTFTKPMSPATVQVNLTPALTLGQPAWTEGNQTLAFTSAQLQPGTRYTVTATGEDVDKIALSGASFAFTTASNASSPPAVATSTPAGLSQGAPPETGITVVFTKPMNRASVESAFSPAQVLGGRFTWNSNGTSMTFQPEARFGNGQTVNWTLSPAAQDQNGKALPAPYTSSFRVARLASVTLSSLSAMDGFVESVSGNINSGGATMDVGDGQRQVYRGFLTFDLNLLPAGATRVVNASLRVHQTEAPTGPYQFLGTSVVSSVDYGQSLDRDDWNLPVLRTVQCSGSPAVCALADETRALGLAAGNGLTATVTATAKVQEDWANRSARSGRSQYRINFSVDNQNKDEFFDIAKFATSENGNTALRPALTVDYEYP